MALGSALTDRARIIRHEPQGAKVDGRTAFSDLPLPWFRARLTINPRPKTRESESRSRVTSRPTLMYGTKDTEGNLVDLSVDDEVEVDSVQLGRYQMYRLDANPTPMRKRRSMVGWEVTVKRVESPSFEKREP